MKVLRAGIAYSRRPQTKKIRARWRRALKRRYLSQRPERWPPEGIDWIGEPPSTPSKAMRRSCGVKLTFPAIRELELPESWSVQFYERFQWPPATVRPGMQPHPFRLFLEIRRGAARPFVLRVHDFQEPWLGETFKARLRRFHPPFPLGLPVSTYLVYDDGISTISLCRWLTVLLAQRSLLTEPEEDEALGAFFRGRGDELQLAFFDAYRRAKKAFIQPIGGNPSFPSYFRRASAAIRAGIVQDKFLPHGDGDQIALKTLRQLEPNLHRALLDRIRLGRVQPVKKDGTLYLLREEANRVDEERLLNSEARKPKRFPDPQRRQRWIDGLMRHGLGHASATRKLKRWMNTLALTEDEIEASITRGRVVRHHRP